MKLSHSDTFSLKLNHSLLRRRYLFLPLCLVLSSVIMLIASCFKMYDRHGGLIIENPQITGINHSGFSLMDFEGRSKSMRIELLGIETQFYDPKTDKGDPCGRDAYVLSTKLLNSAGIRLKLYNIVDDGEDRVKAFVIVQEQDAYEDSDAWLLQGELIRMGYATLQRNELPASKFSRIIINLEQEGKKNKRGIWSVDHCGNTAPRKPETSQPGQGR